MFLNPETSASHALRRLRTGLLASLTATVLAACSTTTAPGPVCQTEDETPSTGTEPSVMASPQPTTSALVAPTSPATPITNQAVARMLAYAERVHLMSPAELSQEATRLGDRASPIEQMQRSLVLSQMLLLPELIRAQELLARVLANNSMEAQSLHALARLLAARYGEFRRLEDQLEKQTQQTREVQRKLDQTNERLEALKAIERSLTSHPPAPKASTPAKRSSRSPAP
jgi:hypothetical protein